MIFDFNWENPQGARGEELRATWSQLQIKVNGEVVTRFLDDRVHAVRDYVILPLFPLAEWIVSNWWFLLGETEPGSRGRRPGFSNRHNLLFAREGFVVPELEFLPSGSMVRLQWRPAHLSDWPGRFLSSGTSHMSTQELETELRSFVEAVLGRLDAERVHETSLHEEWDHLNSLPSEERAFCKAAAALGVDPLNIAPEAEEALLRAHHALSGTPALENEFLQAADPEILLEQLAQMQTAGEIITHHIAPQPRLRGLRHEPIRSDLESRGPIAPWDEGYALAMGVREHLAATDRRFSSFEELVHFVSPGHSPIVPVESCGLFDALVLSDQNGNPGFGIDKLRDEAKSFAFCRGLCEYLKSNGTRSSQARLVTASHTDRQKRNRAFAAEFLAPRHLLRERLSSPIVGSDEIESLAGEFGVSPFVIQHQLSNHGLVERIAS
jgi:hypothetical protein